MKVRVIIATVLSLACVLAAQPSLAVDAYKIELETAPNKTRINLVDTFATSGEGSSFIVANTARSGSSQPDQILCQGFGAPPCDFANGASLRGSLIAPYCLTEAQTNCIQALSVYRDGELPTPAKFVRQGEGEIIKTDPAHNLTEGSTKSLWLANHAHSGGTADYAAFVQLALSIDPQGLFHVASVSANVVPVTLTSGTWAPNKVSQSKSPDGRDFVTMSGGPTGCFFIESKTCGRAQDFASQTRVKVSVRVENTVGGWFKGRMKAPNIDVEGISNTSNLITFDAEPVIVPQFSAVADLENPDPDVAKWIETQNPKPKNVFGTNIPTSISSSLVLVDAFRKVTKDAAAGVNTLWTAETLTGQGNRCIADTSKVLGIVTTNAMVYQGQAPEFRSGALTYKVGGLHYLPDGKTEAEGTYDLVMRSETARCLYGFSQAPVSAQVSVTSATGEAKVATTVVSEKDGWLKMAAYGYTFSSPTISVRLSQAGTAPVSTKKITITCISTKNKKLTKKVTAVNAKCPAGYKKKP